MGSEVGQTTYPKIPIGYMPGLPDFPVMTHTLCADAEQEIAFTTVG